MLEKLEIGRQYNNGIGITVKVVAMGREVVVAENAEKDEYVVGMEYALSNWSELPKPKKRFWKWILEDSYGAQCEPIWFLDDDLKTTNGEMYHIENCVVIKKLEDRFIEVDA